MMLHPNPDLKEEFNYAHVILDHPTNMLNMTVDVVVDQICEKYQNQQEFVLFIGFYYEAYESPDLTEKINTLIREIKKVNPKWKVYLLVNAWYQNHQFCDEAIDDILHIEYYLYRMYKEIIIKKQHVQSYAWSKHQSKFLFLTGRPQRLNRIRLLNKFDRAGLLPHCTWSLFPPNKEHKIYKMYDMMPEFTKEELTALLEKYIKIPDSIKLNHLHGYGGSSYDVNFYSKTKFSVIPETYFYKKDNPWITEKTWRAIINNHPFIMASSPKTLEKLRKMGFATFEDFMPFTNYDNVEDAEQRLDEIVANTEYWLNHITDHADAIQDMIDHNASKILEIYNSNVRRIEDFLKKNNLSLSCDDLIKTKFRPGFINDDVYDNWLSNNKFQIFYNAIRDPSWPDCTNENDFKFLPEKIQRECIDNFGYVPKY